MKEYYEWILVTEKMPPMNKDVLVAYVDKDEEGEKFVEYMVSQYYENYLTPTISLGTMWSLPQYYSQNNVKAWRMIPPFENN